MNETEGLCPNVVVVCIGSEKITGDSLAPLVGELLVDRYNVKTFVYGTVSDSVNGKNMKEWLEFIETVHSGSKIVAVDAGLSYTDGVGTVKISASVFPKKAVKGEAMAVGDVGIVGVVGKVGKNPLSVLMTVSALEVEKIAAEIAFVTFCAISY